MAQQGAEKKKGSKIFPQTWPQQLEGGGGLEGTLGGEF